jgi:hypothetical protein
LLRGCFMRRPIYASAVLAIVIGLLPASARAQERADQGRLVSLPFPGGLAAARAAAGDTGHADAGQFVVDIVRRSFQTPLSTRGLRREAAIRPLLDHLERARSASGEATDRWPLPLPAAVWTTALLGDRATPATLLADILHSPTASLMYCALLSLDDPTRQWLADHPAMLSAIAPRQAALFLVAAPGLRIHDNAIQLPGGAAAAAAWEAAAGKRVTEPAEFIRAITGRSDVALPYLIGSLAQLTAPQVRFVLNLQAGDALQISTLHRLLATFGRVATGWDVAERPFWRPTLDPALLASDLRTTDGGVPVLPGTAAFWSAVLASGDAERATTADAVSTLVSGPPVEFSWLCEQIFSGAQTLIRSPYHLTLLASRLIPAVTAGNARAALAALRGAAQFPAVAGTLEQMHIRDLEVYGAATQAVRALSAIDDEGRAATAYAQFQGALSAIERGVVRGSIPADGAASLVSSLSALRLEHGEYNGAVVEWLASVLLDPRGPAAAALASDRQGSPETRSHDGELLDVIAGPRAERGAPLDWEGSRYRLSFASAEALRLRRVLGDSPHPYVSAASAMVDAARGLESGAASRQALTTGAEAVRAAAAGSRCAEQDAWAALPLADRCRDITVALDRAAKSGDVKNGARLAPRLRQLSDVLLARGLMVLAYAAAIGQPENTPISPFDAASRHTFGFDLPGFGRAGAWRWPASGADRVRDWHLTGSMLGIDVALAQLSFLRISNRPPPVRPSLNDEDRLVLTETIVLMEPDRLTADEHGAIVQALKRGRQRVSAMESPADAEQVAAAARLPAARRSLFIWNVAEDRGRAAASLAPSELLAVGLDGAPPRALDAWGVSGEPRLGCHCLQLPGRPVDVFAGRWFSGILATGFSDLNIRVAEILDEMRMPGALLAPVLAAATWDFVMNMHSNDFDDRNGWIDFATAVGLDRVEQYLALLTTDGPLVPITEGSAPR